MRDRMTGWYVYFQDNVNIPGSSILQPNSPSPNNGVGANVVLLSNGTLVAETRKAWQVGTTANTFGLDRLVEWTSLQNVFTWTFASNGVASAKYPNGQNVVFRYNLARYYQGYTITVEVYAANDPNLPPQSSTSYPLTLVASVPPLSYGYGCPGSSYTPPASGIPPTGTVLSVTPTV